MGDYQKRLLSVIKRAAQATQAAKERAVRGEGLTSAQYGALLVLSHSPGITTSELARRCYVTAQTMSSVLARLVDRGLVSRAAHPRHEGVLEVTVTPAGQHILDLADRHVKIVEAALARALGTAEQEQLRDLLGRCINAADRAFPVDEHSTTPASNAEATAKTAKPS